VRHNNLNSVSLPHCVQAERLSVSVSAVVRSTRV